MLLSLLIAAKIATSQPPKTFPKFDWKTAQPLVIKATLESGAYLPDSPECAKKPPNQDHTLGIICFDPAPFWVEAKDLSNIYGNLSEKHIFVSTISHYGMEQTVDIWKGKPRLLLVLHHDDNYVMPRYAQAIVLTSRSGEEYATLNSSNSIWWLPCSVVDLKEPLNREDFPSSGWSDFYSEKAFPKYGIPLKKLAALLASIKPNVAQITCGREI